MATSDEAVKEKAQFYRSTKLLTLYEGTVRGEGGKGSFLHYDENLAKMPLIDRINQRPTLYPSRLDWSHWDEKKTERPVLGDEDSIKAWAKTVKPHPDFSETDFGTWEGHCGDLWGLQYKLQYQDLSANFGLIAFLRTMTYGIRDVVAVAPFSLDLDTHVLQANNWGKETFSTKLLKEGVLVTKNRPTVSFRPIRETMFNRRYLVGIINFANRRHWLGYIWDAKAKQLFLFDTMDHQKEGRFKAAGVAWREIMTVNGVPFDFTVFGMPASAQSSGWECGFLAVFLITLAIRGMVGLDKQQMQGGIPRERLFFDDPNDKPAGVPFELRFRDWKLGAIKPKPPPQPKKKGKAAKKKETEDLDLDLERVRSFIGCAIMEELGIRDLMYCEGSDDVSRKIDLSLDCEHEFMPADQKLRTSDLYTNLGGFSSVSWKSLDPKKLPDAYRIVPHPATPFGQTPRSSSMYRSDHRKAKFTMPDNLVKMFKERGFEVQKGIPKLPGATGGSVISLDSTVPEKSPTAPKPAPETVPMASFGGIEEIRGLFGTAPSIVEPNEPAAKPFGRSGETEKGAISSLMEGVRKIEASPSPPPKSPSASQLERDIRSPSPRQPAGSDVSMRDVREGSVRSDVSMRDPSPSPPPRQGTRSHRTPTVSAVQFIDGAAPRYFDDDAVFEGRREYANVPIGEAAKKMTIDTDPMNLPRIIKRPTLFMPKSKTYATYIPEGLISLSQWEELIDTAYTDVIPPAIAKISREERYRQREARK